ncbi:hypothetical protein IEO21_07435 [Rhodonia placenta]|uniref:F-box domain-containing protein n=1 Tax=Rhodonia placenta TaxID=104341 RepID=A0A8H7U0C3_9APHY|nr:hypothetical protein IEO21_07435 [Postia placenta]
MPLTGQPSSPSPVTAADTVEPSAAQAENLRKILIDLLLQQAQNGQSMQMIDDDLNDRQNMQGQANHANMNAMPQLQGGYQPSLDDSYYQPMTPQSWQGPMSTTGPYGYQWAAQPLPPALATGQQFAQYDPAPPPPNASIAFDQAPSSSYYTVPDIVASHNADPRMGQASASAPVAQGYSSLQYWQGMPETGPQDLQDGQAWYAENGEHDAGDAQSQSDEVEVDLGYEYEYGETAYPAPSGHPEGDVSGDSPEEDHPDSGSSQPTDIPPTDLSNRPMLPLPSRARRLQGQQEAQTVQFVPMGHPAEQPPLDGQSSASSVAWSAEVDFSIPQSTYGPPQAWGAPTLAQHDPSPSASMSTPSSRLDEHARDGHSGIYESSSVPIAAPIERTSLSLHDYMVAEAAVRQAPRSEPEGGETEEPAQYPPGEDHKSWEIALDQIRRIRVGNALRGKLRVEIPEQSIRITDRCWEALSVCELPKTRKATFALKIIKCSDEAELPSMPRAQTCPCISHSQGPSLPVEIWLEVVAGFVEERDYDALANCTRVCKFFRFWCRRHLSEQMAFKSEQDVERIKADAARAEGWKGPHTVHIIGERESKATSHLSTFVSKFAGRWTEIQWLHLDKVHWPPQWQAADAAIFQDMSRFTSITTLELDGVTFPSVVTLGRLICALPRLTTLWLADVRFLRCFYLFDPRTLSDFRRLPETKLETLYLGTAHYGMQNYSPAAWPHYTELLTFITAVSGHSVNTPPVHPWRSISRLQLHQIVGWKITPPSFARLLRAFSALHKLDFYTKVAGYAPELELTCTSARPGAEPIIITVDQAHVSLDSDDPYAYQILRCLIKMDYHLKVTKVYAPGYMLEALNELLRHAGPSLEHLTLHHVDVPKMRSSPHEIPQFDLSENANLKFLSLTTRRELYEVEGPFAKIRGLRGHGRIEKQDADLVEQLWLSFDKRNILGIGLFWNYDENTWERYDLKRGDDGHAFVVEAPAGAFKGSVHPGDSADSNGSYDAESSESFDACATPLSEELRASHEFILEGYNLHMSSGHAQ